MSTPAAGMAVPIRVLVAKPGLDGHDRGAKVLAQALRDAGMEVIYTGLRVTPQMIASAAVQEDVDIICASILSGAHNSLVEDMVQALQSEGADDIPLLVGGVIPRADFEHLKSLGVREIFTPGARLDSIVEFVHTVLGR